MRRPTTALARTTARPADPAEAPDPADPALEVILGRVRDVVRSLKSGVPDWVAAELTLGQLRLLFRLARQGPQSMGGIGEWLGTGLPSVTGTIERLERHGLVERRHRTDDRRVVEARLTDQGRELVVEILGIRTETIRRLLGYLQPAELRELDHLFGLIIERSGGSAS